MNNLKEPITNMTNIEKIKTLYLGKSITDLPTPSFVINRSKFSKNCEALRENMKALERKTNIKLKFRPHMKTHKTIEGLLIQLEGGNFSKSVLVSTLAEAEYILSDPRSNAVVEEICYTLPITQNEIFIDRLRQIGDQVKLILFIDHIDQLNYLKNVKLSEGKKWNVFLKIDVGTQRAGIHHKDLEYLKEAFETLAINSTAFELYGIYAHAGHSYGCTNKESVNDVLIEELKCVIDVADFHLKQNNFYNKLVLSIGGTPTIKAIEDGHEDFIGLLSTINKDKFELELHCGNYCMLDLQQASTKVSRVSDIAGYVLSSIVSNYSLRNESLCNAGVLALTRETSSYKGFGTIFEIEKYLDLQADIEIAEDHSYVAKVSQEHGIIKNKVMPIGQAVAILPQHACIVAASHPFFVITDDSHKVIDIWVPCRGW